LQVRHVRSFQNAGVFQTGNEMLRDCWRDGEGFRKKTRAKGESLENPPMSPLFYIKNRLLSTYEQSFFELFLQVFGKYCFSTVYDVPHGRSFLLEVIRKTLERYDL